MSRFLAFFFSLALLMAWTTSAVAAYCKHETVASEQNHLGHHSDRDHLPSATPDPDTQDGTNKPHAHCSLSHVFSSACPMSGADFHCLWIPAQIFWLPDALPLPSALPDEPERPKWPIAA